MENEWVLIQKAQKNPKAFRPLYDTHFQQIFSFIFHRVGDKDLAADITSQTFLKALTNIGKYKPMGYRFSAWLYKIALNEVRYHFRKQTSSREFYADDQVIQNIEEAFEEPFDEELLALINSLISHMGEDAVQLIELRFFEQKSFKDISCILGISEANAKMRTYRLIEKIKEQINEKV